jgi:hypothetical protein
MAAGIEMPIQGFHLRICGRALKGLNFREPFTNLGYERRTRTVLEISGLSREKHGRPAGFALRYPFALSFPLL